jgi:hypothetical protein
LVIPASLSVPFSIAGEVIPNRVGRRPRDSPDLRDGRMLPITAKGDAKERHGDTECRENRSFESARNFGDTTAAPRQSVPSQGLARPIGQIAMVAVLFIFTVE